MLLGTIPFSEMLVRLILACVAGGIIGLEREMRGRAAGLRTTLLTCVAAAVAIIGAEQIFGGHGDGSSRVMQGVLTGIGFLGAGAINREGRQVHGLTTAAVLWIATILGMTFGAGQWQFGLLGVGLTMFILVVLRKLETSLRRDWIGTIGVTVQMAGISDTEIKHRLEAAGLHVKHVSLDYDLDAKQRTMRCELKCHKDHMFQMAEQIANDLAQCRGMIAVNWVQG